MLDMTFDRTLSGNYNVTSGAYLLRLAEFQFTMMFLLLDRPTLYDVMVHGNYVYPRKLVTVEVVSPPVTEMSSFNNNGTWTGIMGILQREEADFITFPTTIDYEKLKAVDFLDIYLVNKLVVTSRVRKIHYEADLMDDFSKADWKVWVLLLFTMICVISVMVMMDYDGHIKPSDIAFLYVSYFLDAGSPAVLSTQRSRVIATFFFFFVIVFKTSIFAYLKTNLVAVDNDKINSLHELVQRSDFSPVVIVRNGDIIDALQNSDNPDYQALMNNAKNTKDGIFEIGELLTKFDGSLSDILARDAFVGERTTMYSTGHTMCSMQDRSYEAHLVQEDISGTMYGLPSKKWDGQSQTGSKSLKSINKWVVQAGLVDYVVKQLMGGEMKCAHRVSETDVVEVKPLKLGGFKKTFFFLLIGQSLAFIVFVYEKCRGRNRAFRM